MRTIKNETDPGIIQAANNNLRACIKTIVENTMAASEVLKLAEKTNTILDPNAISLFDDLADCTEDFEIALSQYKQEILGLDEGFDDDDFE